MCIYSPGQYSSIQGLITGRGFTLNFSQTYQTIHKPNPILNLKHKPSDIQSLEPRGQTNNVRYFPKVFPKTATFQGYPSRSVRPIACSSRSAWPPITS